MTVLVVDRAQLRSAIDHMAAFVRDVDAILEDIEHTLAGLRASWHGEASEAQAQAQQRWQTGATQMREALAQLANIADKAHKNYSDAVDKNGKMWE